MESVAFADLPLEDWKQTRDSLHAWTQVLGAIRAAATPRQKHWWHTPLAVAAAGLTTTPICIADRTVELVLSPSDHRLYLTTNRGQSEHIALTDQSTAALSEAITTTLSGFGITLPIDRKTLSDTAPRTYDKAAAQRYWSVLPLIDAVLKQLKGEHRGESGPVLLWPHGFDLAVLLFSGRRVPGKDPADEESADEQMNFGFVTGDAGIAEPYFYVTAYPTPAGLVGTALPDGARWHDRGWTGAVMPYRAVSGEGSMAKILAFFRAARDAGFARMK